VAVRVSARAIGVADGFQLWAQRFESTPGELLTLNDRIAEAVAKALSRGGGRDERAPIVDPRALELYVAARSALRQAWTGLKPFAPVLSMFEQARALAPDDPMILSGAAMARARAANYNQASSTARLEARELAERALALAPASTEPWFARASLDHVEGRWPEAVISLRRALASNAAYLPGQKLLASILGEVGPLDDAILRFDVVAELDPSSHYAAIIQSQLHLLAGRVDEALRCFPKAADWDDAVQLAIYAARENLWLGGEQLEVVDPPSTFPSAVAVRALRLALLRDPAATDGLEAELARAPAGSRFRLLISQLEAELRMALGQGESALRAIEQAAATGLYDAMWLDGCPLLAPLRSDPRFVSARATVEARAVEVRAALTRPL
jgi:serine/threonine-protein kinase